MQLVYKHAMSTLQPNSPLNLSGEDPAEHSDDDDGPEDDGAADDGDDTERLQSRGQ